MGRIPRGCRPRSSAFASAGEYSNQSSKNWRQVLMKNWLGLLRASSGRDKSYKETEQVLIKKLAGAQSEIWLGLSCEKAFLITLLREFKVYYQWMPFAVPFTIGLQPASKSNKKTGQVLLKKLAGQIWTGNLRIWVHGLIKKLRGRIQSKSRGPPVFL